MKFLRAGKKGLVFHLDAAERQLLLETIKLYPLVPATHHRLSQSPVHARADENQRLLDEALSEQRAENRRQVVAMLASAERFRELKSGFHLTLSRSEIEWLLQVLNDIRVGSWLALGEPEQGTEPKISRQNAKYLLAMELGGAFEYLLLEALGVSDSPEWAGG